MERRVTSIALQKEREREMWSVWRYKVGSYQMLDSIAKKIIILIIIQRQRQRQRQKQKQKRDTTIEVNED